MRTSVFTSAVVLGILIGLRSTDAGTFPGTFPHAYKYNPNESERSPQTPIAGFIARAMAPATTADDVLESSQEALHVTERRYLKMDWCKTQPLKQTIHEEGCLSRTIINRFCYGQCNSFYIPRHMGPTTGGGHQGKNRGTGSSGRRGHKAQQEPFQSCSFCRPHRVTQLTVQLDCPGSDPPFRHRKVQRVKQCRCMSVDVSSPGKL